MTDARPWLLVAGDFTPLGGMDCANHALALYLARERKAEVHLVAHRASDDLTSLPNIHLHAVRRPAGSHLLGMPLLASAGQRWARRLAGHVVVNGGNCAWADMNWVHYVHAAWPPRQGEREGLARRAKAAFFHRYALRAERLCVRQARHVIANSERTRSALIERLDLAPERVHTVYYGIDSTRFRPATSAERAQARAQRSWSDDRPAVAFVGALGDARKGFDTLFEAWRILAREPSWDARLVVAGAGPALAGWRQRAQDTGLAGSVEFVGYCAEIPRLLAACDLLASPTRYEPYGLNVHEALCCGLPALVSASAGVAERYPAALADLLLPDPEDAAGLAQRLRAWRSDPETYRARVAPLGDALRARSWNDCAAEIVALAE